MGLERLVKLSKEPVIQIFGGAVMTLTGVVLMNSAPTHNNVAKGVEIAVTVLGFANLYKGVTRDMDKKPDTY